MITNLKLVLTSLSLKTKSCDVLFDSLSFSQSVANLALLLENVFYRVCHMN